MRVSAGLSLLDVLGVVSALLGFIAAVQDAARAWRQDRRAVLTTLQLIAAYVIYGGVGIFVAVRLLDGPQPPDRAAALTAFLLAWILFGTVWLTRIVPRTSPLPRWIGEGFGVLDVVLLLTGAAGLRYFMMVDVL